MGDKQVCSVGRAIPGVTVEIHGDDDEPVPVNQIGEVCVRGPNVMACYLNNPEATARVLKHDWLHTGDLGRLDNDGCLYLSGRRDDLILRGGENIYPTEIENVLCDHPCVREAAVMAVPHSVLGSDLVGCVVLVDGQKVDEDILRAYCRDHLASFKVPRTFRFMKTLPKTPNGKLSRLFLQKAFVDMEVRS